MATTLATPAAAPASAAAPVAAPVASPSPAAAPVAAPSTATAALSSQDSINTMMEFAKGKGVNDDLSVAKPAAAVEPAKPAEAAPQAKPEDKPAAEAAKSAVSETPSYSLEEDGFVGAKDLAAKLDADPTLKASLPAELRNEIMANARLAERGAEYQQIFASPAEAKIVAQTAQDFAAFSDAFNMVGADVEKGTSALINKLIEASALRDAEGNPVKNDNGTFKTDGTASKFLTTAAKRWFAINVVQKIEALGNENVTAALDLVMESAGLRPSTAAKMQTDDPALTARKAELDAQETRLREQTQASSKAERQQYDSALEGDLATAYTAEAGALLGLATGLDGFTKQAVEQKIEAAVKKAIASSVSYKMRKNALQQQPRSPERRQREVALAKEFLRDNLARIARPILTEAGILVKGKLGERAAAQAARAEAARSEIGSGAPVSPATMTGPSSNPQQQIAQAREAYKAANGGKEPDDSQLNIFMMLNYAKSKGFAA